MDEGIFFFTFLSFLILLAVLGKLFAVDRRLKKLEKSLKTPEEKVVVPAPEKPAAPFGNRLTVPRESEQGGQSELAAEAGKFSGWMSRFWKWFCVGSQREGVSAEYAAATTWLIRCGVVILLLAVAFSNTRSKTILLPRSSGSSAPLPPVSPLPEQACTA